MENLRQCFFASIEPHPPHYACPRLRRATVPDGRVSVRLILSPPDRRVRDIDNVRKAIYDAISDRRGHKGIITDDADIKTDSAFMIAPGDGEITVYISQL